MGVRPIPSLAVLGMASLLAGCAEVASWDDQPGCEGGKCDFFENSRRRPATPEEQVGLVRLPGCAGAYVANADGRAIVLTARHCVGYSMTDWCREGGTIRDAWSGTEHTCARVVAGDGYHDPVLIEVEGEQPPVAFRLAGFGAGERLRLKMLGYPGDPYAPAGLTVTENCWVQKAVVASPFRGEPEGQYMVDDTFAHNCSVYGGNSGGPLLIEGTDIILGQPSAYHPGEFGNHPFHWASYGAALTSLIAEHRKTLEEEGIDIAEAPEPAVVGDYLPVGRYESETLDCVFVIVPIYLTGPRLESVKVSYECLEDEPWNMYECTGDPRYCYDYTGTYLHDLTARSFVYRDQYEGDHDYYLK